ncbi:MAG: rhodanese-like domain-containing protein [Melioribacteraceae bacterium]|nr:rhodanese-like domain-containing protein [Melioribacteraceae bacterium]MCF8430808.1 rhodanese-like domain-containing protein [Melioribacteraceae bacterium]
MKNLLKIFSMIMFFNLISCAQQSDEFNMTVVELDNKMKTDSTLVILDVRTAPELTGPLGRIEGVINIPVQELQQRLSELENYKTNNIAVICRSGNRSRTATSILNSAGYNAKNVIGGMKEYNKLPKN